MPGWLSVPGEAGPWCGQVMKADNVRGMRTCHTGAAFADERALFLLECSAELPCVENTQVSVPTKYRCQNIARPGCCRSNVGG